MLRRKNRETGFTLIEMMIVVAIISIAAAIAIPNYLEWVSRYELRQSVSEIASQLMLARMGAMNRNRTVTVSIAVASGHVTVTGTDINSVIVTSNDQAVPHVISTNPPSPSIAFTSLGLRSGGGATDQVVQIANDRGTTYSFRVTPGGKTSWCPKSTCP